MGDKEAGELLREAMTVAEASGDPYPQIRKLVGSVPMHIAPNGDSFVYSYTLAQEVLHSGALFKNGQYASSTPPGLTDEQRQQLRDESPDDRGMLTSIDDPITPASAG